MTLTALGPTDAPQTILIEANIRTSGTGTCANPGAGFTRVVLRTLAVHDGSTLALNFNGPPLVVRTGVSGRLICFGYRAISVPNGSQSDVGMTFYPFVP